MDKHAAKVEVRATPEARDGEPTASKTSWRLVPVLAFLTVASIFGIALMKGDPSRLPSALAGKPAPPLNLPALDALLDGGRPIPGISAATLASGKPVVVNFWASWCPPCVAEHPVLIDLVNRTGVSLVGVNYKDQAPAARRFLGRYGNPYAAVGVDSNGRGAIDWGVAGMPETFVLDGQGRIVAKHIGPITPESLEKQILPALAKAASASPVPPLAPAPAPAKGR